MVKRSGRFTTCKGDSSSYLPSKGRLLFVIGTLTFGPLSFMVGLFSLSITVRTYQISIMTCIHHQEPSWRLESLDRETMTVGEKACSLIVIGSDASPIYTLPGNPQAPIILTIY